MVKGFENYFLNTPLRTLLLNKDISTEEKKTEKGFLKAIACDLLFFTDDCAVFQHLI